MHVLDRPVWHALTGPQASLAIGDQRALRMDPPYGPFAAAADPSQASQYALAALVNETGEVWIVEPEECALPPGVRSVRQGLCVQMVTAQITPVAPGFAVETLGEDDAGAMRALAHLTVPGPFHNRTHQLGRFIGVKVDGQLVAMAGERMRPEGHIEVSGVCTHPDFQGRGYAKRLMSIVAARILDEGQMPFLHAYAQNETAIALYESLGFAVRRTIMATVLDRL